MKKEREMPTFIKTNKKTRIRKKVFKNKLKSRIICINN
jgi:hypothetical protein